MSTRNCCCDPENPNRCILYTFDPNTTSQEELLDLDVSIPAVINSSLLTYSSGGVLLSGCKYVFSFRLKHSFNEGGIFKIMVAKHSDENYVRVEIKPGAAISEAYIRVYVANEETDGVEVLWGELRPPISTTTNICISYSQRQETKGELSGFGYGYSGFDYGYYDWVYGREQGVIVTLENEDDLGNFHSLVTPLPYTLSEEFALNYSYFFTRFNEGEAVGTFVVPLYGDIPIQRGVHLVDTYKFDWYFESFGGSILSFSLGIEIFSEGEANYYSWDPTIGPMIAGQIAPPCISCEPFDSCYGFGTLEEEVGDLNQRYLLGWHSKAHRNINWRNVPQFGILGAGQIIFDLDVSSGPVGIITGIPFAWYNVQEENLPDSYIAIIFSESELHVRRVEDGVVVEEVFVTNMVKWGGKIILTPTRYNSPASISMNGEFLGYINVPVSNFWGVVEEGGSISNVVLPRCPELYETTRETTCLDLDEAIGDSVTNSTLSIDLGDVQKQIATSFRCSEDWGCPTCSSSYVTQDFLDHGGSYDLVQSQPYEYDQTRFEYQHGNCARQYCSCQSTYFRLNFPPTEFWPSPCQEKYCYDDIGSIRVEFNYRPSMVRSDPLQIPAYRPEPWGVRTDPANTLSLTSRFRVVVTITRTHRPLYGLDSQTWYLTYGGSAEWKYISDVFTKQELIEELENGIELRRYDTIPACVNYHQLGGLHQVCVAGPETIFLRKAPGDKPSVCIPRDPPVYPDRVVVLRHCCFSTVIIVDESTLEFLPEFHTTIVTDSGDCFRIQEVRDGTPDDVIEEITVSGYQTNCPTDACCAENIIEKVIIHVPSLSIWYNQAKCFSMEGFTEEFERHACGSKNQLLLLSKTIDLEEETDCGNLSLRLSFKLEYCIFSAILEFRSSSIATPTTLIYCRYILNSVCDGEFEVELRNPQAYVINPEAQFSTDGVLYIGPETELEDSYPGPPPSSFNLELQSVSCSGDQYTQCLDIEICETSDHITINSGSGFWQVGDVVLLSDGRCGTVVAVYIASLYTCQPSWQLSISERVESCSDSACNPCECLDEHYSRITVSAVTNCLCGPVDSSKAVSVPVEPGKYRLQFCDGAVRTRNIEPSPPYDLWMYTGGANCGGLAMYAIFYGLGGSNIESVTGWTIAPASWGGVASYSDAVEASLGMFDEFDVEDETRLWLFFNDDDCTDGEGEITWCLKKIACPENWCDYCVPNIPGPDDPTNYKVLPTQMLLTIGAGSSVASECDDEISNWNAWVLGAHSIPLDCTGGTASGPGWYMYISLTSDSENVFVEISIGFTYFEPSPAQYVATIPKSSTCFPYTFNANLVFNTGSVGCSSENLAASLPASVSGIILFDECVLEGE